jgi:hypothetical protein
MNGEMHVESFSDVASVYPAPDTTGSPPLIRGLCCWGAAQEVLASLSSDIEATGLPWLPRQGNARLTESLAL